MKPKRQESHWNEKAHLGQVFPRHLGRKISHDVAGDLLVPPGINFRLIAVLHAMLARETAYSQAAFDSYDALVKLVAPIAELVVDHSSGLATMGGWQRIMDNNLPLPRSKKHPLRDMALVDVENTPAFNDATSREAVARFTEACSGFAGRFAEGSKPLAEMVFYSALVDALGVDMASIEKERQARSEKWGAMYGPPSVARTNSRAQAINTHGWVRVPKFLERDAYDFVSAYFEWPAVTDWIRTTQPESRPADRHYYDRFRPFAKALQLEPRRAFLGR